MTHKHLTRSAFVNRGAKTLGCSAFGSQPSKQEEVVPTERTPIGQKDPEEGHLDSVPNAYTPKIDGSAMWTS
jgi:hypothetical protein